MAPRRVIPVQVIEYESRTNPAPKPKPPDIAPIPATSGDFYGWCSLIELACALLDLLIAFL